LFSMCLRREGYEVQEAANGEQGLKSARKRHPDWCCLMSDCRI